MKINILIVSFYLLGFVAYCKTPYVNSKNYKATNNIGVIYGTWVIKKAVSGDITAITEKLANEFVGKKVVFKPDYAKVVNDSCGKPIYESKLQNASSYIYDNYRTSKKILGDITDTINVVEVTCNEKPFYNSKKSPNFAYDLIVLNEQSLIIDFYGFFFYLERSRNILKTYNFSGTGKDEEKVLIPHEASIINLNYEFYAIPAKIVVRNQLGEILYESEMTTTQTIQKPRFYLNKKTDCLIITIENAKGNASSKWQFGLEIE